MTQHEYDRIKQEIVSEFDRKLAALDVVMGIYRGIPVSDQPRKPRPHREGFSEKVRVACKIANQEFTVSDILKIIGRENDSSEVSMRLSNLRSRGELEVIRTISRGASIPMNVYRLTESKTNTNGNKAED